MSLPELLVAMACAALVGYMAFDLIRGESGHYTRTRGKIRVQSDVRDAMRVVEDDLLNAGYRFGLGSTPTTLGPKTCNLTPATATPVEMVDGTSSDQLTFRSFKFTADGYPDCGTRYDITYSVDASGNLVRQLTTTTATGASVGAASVVLPNVVTFQVQIGTDPSADPTSPPVADQLFQSVSQGFPSGRIATSSNITATEPTTDQMKIAGWTANMLAVVPGAASVQLAANSTYHLEMCLNPNEDFVKWMDPAKPATNYFRIGFRDATTHQWIPGFSTRISALPKKDVDTRVSWTFRTSAAIAGEFAMEGMLNPAASMTTSPFVVLSGLRLNRIRNAGQTATNGGDPNPNWIWNNGDGGSAALRRETLALRLWILARSARENREMAQPSFSGIGNWDASGFKPGRNSYALQERVLPLVNP